jgi:hypothetical protein
VHLGDDIAFDMNDDIITQNAIWWMRCAISASW